MPLKVLGMWALVPLELVSGPGVWLTLRMLVSQPSTLANCSLVLSLQQDFDCERVEDVGLLVILLLVLRLAGASSQLGSLSAGTILGLGTGETVQPGWIVLEGDCYETLWTWTIFIFFFLSFSDFIGILFSFFSFGQWRGMWHCSHMTCYIMWCHRPRRWWKDLEDDVRAHVYNIVTLRQT